MRHFYPDPEVARRSFRHQMTAGLAQARQIVIDELAIACEAEALEMVAMHDADRQGPDALERRLIVVTLGMMGIIRPAAAIGA